MATVSAQLAKSDFVTVDTEFIRETTFWPELCLIQMAAPGVTALVDPLAPGIDLAPFFELMANEAVTKVFHAARQDIEIVFNLGRLIPHPVFDTQVAAMVCGFGDSVSYDQLVQKITGAQIDKSSRFTDWRARPLSDKQLVYALADVTHLIDVYKYLKAELEREGRAHWLNEEMAILTAHETYDPHPEDAWKRSEDAPAQAGGAGHRAGGGGLARARGARAQRAAPAGASRTRPSTRSPSSSRAMKHRSASCGPFPERLGAFRHGRLAARRGQHGACRSRRKICRNCRRPAQNPEGSNAAAELLKVLLRLVAEEGRRRVESARLVSDDIDRIAGRRRTRRRAGPVRAGGARCSAKRR